MGGGMLTSTAVIEQSHGLLGHDFPVTYTSDAILSPPSSSRSITTSPPHHSIVLSAQQRELNRQRERIRREAKIASRRQATHGSSPSSSPPSSSFLPSPPAPMADMSASSATGGLPGIYATSSAPHNISLLSQPATTSAGLGSPSYMATGGSYSTSMHGHHQPGVFSASYQSQGYMPEYTTASFPASSPPTLQSQYPYVTLSNPTSGFLAPANIRNQASRHA